MDRPRSVLTVASLALVAACSTDEFTTPNDSGASADAGLDATTTFCTAHPSGQGALCDDFERTFDGGFDPSWTVQSSTGGTLAREAEGPGFVLHATLPGGAGTKRTSQLVWDPNSTVVRHVVASAKVKLAPSCANGYGIFAVGGLAGTTAVAIIVGVGTSASAKTTLNASITSLAADASTPSVVPLEGTTTFAFDTWLDFGFDIEFDRPREAGPNGGVDMTVTLGGKPQIVIRGGEGGAAIGFPKIAVGLSTAGTAQACDARFDDVLLSATP